MNRTFKSKTASTGFFTHHKPFRPTISALPCINHPKGDIIIPNNEMKDKIISLKKVLNKRMFEYQELKLAHIKLNQEKEFNKKLLDEAITETKLTCRPLEMSRSNSPREMKISFDSYYKLKEANSISSMKHQISVLQKMIKQKEEEIEDLKSDSKVNKLIERNNQLVDLINKTGQLGTGIHELRLLLADKENKTSEDISNRDYYKALNINLKCENEMLSEKYELLSYAVDLRMKKVSSHQEKANNLKYKYNTTKQTEKTKDIELQFHQEQLSYEEDYKKNKEKNSEEYKKNAKAIQQLKEEIEAKEKMIKTLEKNNCAYVQQISKKQTKIKKNALNESNQIDALKKEMIRLDKEMGVLRNRKESLVGNNAKMQEVFERNLNCANRIKGNNKTCGIYREIKFDIIIKDTNFKKKLKLELTVDSTTNNIENNCNSIMLSSHTTSFPNPNK